MPWDSGFYTPAEPRRHPLPYAACGGVAIDRGRLLYIGRAGGGHALFLGDLAGSAAQVVAAAPRGVFRAFDLEGERALYEPETCGGASALRVASLQGTAPDAVRTQTRPVRLASRRAPLRSGGRLAVRLRCRQGCDLYATLARLAKRGIPRLRQGR